MSFAHGGDSMSRPAANQSLDRLFRCTAVSAASGGALNAQCSGAPWTTVVGKQVLPHRPQARTDLQHVAPD